MVCEGLEKQSTVWLAWDDVDQGTTMDGWTNVRFVKVVRPESPIVECPLPDGWGGDGKKALRVFLSEVPGNVDCTFTSITSDGNQYLICKDKRLTGAARVEMDCTLKVGSGTKPMFCSRGNSTTKNQFVLFADFSNKRWRFDYNKKTGTSATWRAKEQRNSRR